MSGAIYPLPNTPSWRHAQLKAQGQLYLHVLRMRGGSYQMMGFNTGVPKIPDGF
jgi:hypothetical protein